MTNYWPNFQRSLRVVVVDELVVGAVARAERDLKQSGRERLGVWEIGVVDLDQVCRLVAIDNVTVASRHVL
eukprot:4125347-Prymnesium_polylepis.1